MTFKISALIFIKDTRGRFLLIERAKAPNAGLWSPIGGKLEMAAGESPYECAVRESREEAGIELANSDLHLFCMATEKAYEGKCHWLMFLFACHKPLECLPEHIEEGRFGFFSRQEIQTLPIPGTDREGLWKMYDNHHRDFVAVNVDCQAEGPIDFRIEESYGART